MMKDFEQEIDVLKRQVKALRKRSIEASEYIDTVTSPLWKRIIWWFEGFYFRKVGKWAFKKWTPRWPK